MSRCSDSKDLGGWVRSKGVSGAKTCGEEFEVRALPAKLVTEVGFWVTGLLCHWL